MPPEVKSTRGQILILGKISEFDQVRHQVVIALQAQFFPQPVPGGFDPGLLFVHNSGDLLGAEIEL